jgi:hypothetical protein
MLLLELVDVQRPAHEYAEFVDINRLAKEVVRPLPDCLASVLPLFTTRNDNHFGLGVLMQDVVQSAEAFRHSVGIWRQAKIQRDDCWALSLEDIQSILPICRHKDVVILSQGPAHLPTEFFVVIHEKQFG